MSLNPTTPSLTCSHCEGERCRGRIIMAAWVGTPTLPVQERLLYIPPYLWLQGVVPGSGARALCGQEAEHRRAKPRWSLQQRCNPSLSTSRRPLRAASSTIPTTPLPFPHRRPVRSPSASANPPPDQQDAARSASGGRHPVSQWHGDAYEFTLLLTTPLLFRGSLCCCHACGSHLPGRATTQAQAPSLINLPKTGPLELRGV